MSKLMIGLLACIVIVLIMSFSSKKPVGVKQVQTNQETRQATRDEQEIYCWQLSEIYYGIIMDRAAGVSRSAIEERIVVQAGSNAESRDAVLYIVDIVFRLPSNVDAEKFKVKAKTQCMNVSEMTTAR